MWIREAITDGEIDALGRIAQRAWDDDTRSPLWIGRSGVGCGQCYVTACWLVSRLGGSVGRRVGHYAWLSPGGDYLLDLTGDHTGSVYYGPNDGYESLSAQGFIEPHERAQRFIKRANRIFESLVKHGDLAGADAYPGEEPERAALNSQDEGPYWHDEPVDQRAAGDYQFVYANGQLEVAPSHMHDYRDLAQHVGVDLDHSGPMAVGYVTVLGNKATWDVQSNMNLHSLVRVFKDYSKHVGWEWGGMADLKGQPINDTFAPKKTATLRYIYGNDHLWLGSTTLSDLALRCGDLDDSIAGELHIRGSSVRVSNVHPVALPALYEWAEDQGLQLYALHDNQLKTIPDLEVKDNYNPNPTEQEGHEYFHEPRENERAPSGLYSCPSCRRLFPNWHEYQKHRKSEESWVGQPAAEEDGGFPETNMDATFPTHFTEQQPSTMPVASVREAARVDGFKGGDESDQYFVTYQYGCPVAYARVRKGKILDVVAHRGTRLHLFAGVQRFTGQDPSRALPGPVPFIFDIKEDNVTVGNPGTRTAEIPGRFTPGGIVEGTYEPGGKVLIRTMTNMPYSVHHMVSLWYYQHPELAVKSVYLHDDAGGTTKLAAESAGTLVAAMVAADPAVHSAATALRATGGNVYAVGGAVRDAVRGEPPKDIDLMVTGLPSEEVERVLEGLPGRVDYTGKAFGVFRYRSKGHEVEIALPRRERSTGAGHQDFDVQSDHTMKVEDDLQRRDFTANAMAVDLSSGELIDPYGGSGDIGAGKLRTITDTSLSEDPLRVVRALVAHARHGFQPDDVTRAQMQANAESLHHLPSERIQEELDKLFSAKDPAAAIKLAHETGVLKHLLPEVDAAFGYNQNNPHHELELGEHLTNVLRRTAEKSHDPDLRLAALLHDIGKPSSAWVDPETGSNHYYLKVMPDGTRLGADHEEVGAEMAKGLMQRLNGYGNDRIKRVSDLVQHHMWKAFTTTRGARRFLARVGDHADDLMTLRWADQGGKSEYPTDPTLSLNTQRNLIEQVRNAQEPTKQADLAINGNDILAAGVPAGPQIGEILRDLTEKVIEEPQLNDRNTLLNLVHEYGNLREQ